MSAVEHIRTVQSGNRVLAIFVHRGLPVDGARFVTEEKDALQLGIFERPAGYRVRAHRHRTLPAEERDGAEFLAFESGEAKVTIYDDTWNLVAEEIVRAGDVLLLLAGGHQMEMLKPTRFLEVKQGPYPGDARAKIFRDPS